MTMTKTEVKHAFLEYVPQHMPRPITQSAIEEAFKAFVSELVVSGEVNATKASRWYRIGSGIDARKAL